jgi:L-ascorbate metabolism protein UlaG (beta-lactamase superfamily)
LLSKAMPSIGNKLLLLSLLGVFAFMLTGCGRYWDLAKILGKNLVYEIQHPVCPPAVPMKFLPAAGPGLHELWAGWIGHSTVLLSFSGILILTDPNFSSRIKVARRVVGLPIEPEEIENLHLVLISHAHYDHLDIPSLKRLPKEALIVVPPGCRDLVEDLGFTGVVELGWDERFSFQDLEIEAFKPAHWGKRSPVDDKNRAYNAYLVTKGGKSVLFAGDTGYSKIFAEKTCDKETVISFLPITAYSPEWFRLNHINPEEAIQIFLETGSRFMIPIHWGTFILSHEPIDEPMERLNKEAARLGVEKRVIVLKHGESFIVPENSSSPQSAQRTQR